jgi:23S rRNA G2069 N7-methylase RlmK/C1962 C5-methylase RlmI
LADKFILDACCGGRTIWFNKQHPAVLYIDIRKEEKGFSPERPNFCVQPDRVMDFRKLEFGDRTFKLIVWDPPHMKEGKAGRGIMRRKYGALNRETWQEDLRQGFKECWRVLEDNGVLIFKCRKSSRFSTGSRSLVTRRAKTETQCGFAL